LLVGWVNIAVCAAMITIQRPMILARTGGNALALGQVSSAMAAGAALGGLVLVISGGTRRRLRDWFAFCSIAAVAMMVFGLSRSIAVWAVSGLFYSAGISMAAMHVEAMIVAKTPPHLLGRIQGCRDLISRLPGALVQLSLGPLADFVFEPAMTSDTRLLRIFGGLVGRGPGAGMAVMIVIGSGLALLGIAGAALIPRVRNADSVLQDQM